MPVAGSLSEKRLTTRRMLGDCLLTVTPVALTTSGRVGSAWLTRFCTSTWAMSRSAFRAKVTVRV